MIYDDDLPLAAAVFEAGAAALSAVEPPDRRQPLQQHGAAHAGLQPFDVLVLFAHRSVLLSGPAGQGMTPCVPFLFYPPSGTPATAKPARDKGVRSTGAQSATHPVARRAQAALGFFCSFF